MNTRLALPLVCLLLASCHSHPLTDAECDTLASRDADQYDDQYPPDQAGWVNSMMKKRIPGRTERCKAGRGYDRKDYECVMGAKTPLEMDSCWTKARTHGDGK